MSQRYPTDLTDTEWTVLTPLIPAAKPGGRPRTTDMREVVNAIFYVLRGGCQWRLLPTDFPPPPDPSTISSGPGDVQACGSGCTPPCGGIYVRPLAARVSPVRGSAIARR
jgi:Putative transposase of IS4/5 family (DUF4096)